MFTGLIETMGTVREVRHIDRSLRLTIEPTIVYEVKRGDSVSVDGVCLTVESFDGKTLCFTAVAETLSCTTLARVQPGRRVNLERALRLDGRLGGHFVLGHVDGVGRIVEDRRAGVAIERRIWAPASLRPFFAPKGSVAVDGISLTIARCFSDGFAVALVPHTLESTTASSTPIGASVNIECDILIRYIFHLIKSGAVGVPSIGLVADKAATLFEK